jgi:hypothetical protein
LFKRFFRKAQQYTAYLQKPFSILSRHNKCLSLIYVMQCYKFSAIVLDSFLISKIMVVFEQEIALTPAVLVMVAVWLAPVPVTWAGPVTHVTSLTPS